MVTLGRVRPALFLMWFLPLAGLAFLATIVPAQAQALSGEAADDAGLLRSGLLLRDYREAGRAVRLPDFPRAQIAASLADDPYALDSQVDRVLVRGEAQHLHRHIAGAAHHADLTPPTLSEFVARTEQILTDQQFTGGVLTIAIVERDRDEPGVIRVMLQQPELEDVVIVGAPDNIRPFLRAMGARLRDGSRLTEDRLERYLILFNRVPGCKTRLELRPTSPFGRRTSMMLHVEYDRLSAYTELNSRGPRGISREVIYNKLVVNDVIAGADYLDLRATTNIAPGRALILDASYGVNIDADGLVLELSAFNSSIRPSRQSTGGDQLDIGFLFYGATLTRPLWLRERSQLFLSLGLSSGRARFMANDLAFVEEKRRAAILSLEWIRLAFGGINTGKLTLVHGFDALGASQRGDPLVTRGGVGGDFSYVSFKGSREQPLGPWAALSTEIFAQLSADSLFVTDQCTYGGGDYGRGFELNAIFGDSCFLGTSELRLKPAFLDFGPSRVEPYLYADGGAMHQVGVADPSQPRNVGRMSAGGGIRIMAAKNLSARLEFTQALRRDTPTGAGQERLFYFEIGAEF